MSQSPTDPFENMRKAILALQAMAKPIMEWQTKMNESMKPYLTLVYINRSNSNSIYFCSFSSSVSLS